MTTSIASQFPLVKKKYTLKNVYYKNTMYSNTYPREMKDLVAYFREWGDLPFELPESQKENWLYYAYCEYQKRHTVYLDQFFTPPATAQRMADLIDQLFVENKVYLSDQKIVDLCCGFGMLSKPLVEHGYRVVGIDMAWDMEDLYTFYTDDMCNYVHADVTEPVGYLDLIKNAPVIVSNPPYDVPKLTKILSNIHPVMNPGQRLVMLLPRGFVEKSRPKAFVEVMEKFSVTNTLTMNEDFERTKIKAEIVVLQPNL